MIAVDEIKRKCHNMLIRKDYDRGYYEGYIQALRWVVTGSDKYNK
jgi:hypothetical protein